MNEQPLNMQVSVREIWRHRLLIAVVALVCGFATVAYGCRASSRIDGGCLGSASTEPAIKFERANAVSSNRTTDRREHARSGSSRFQSIPPLGPTELKKLVTVTPLSGQLFSIDAQAPDGRYATQIANAVAASFITYLRQVNDDSSRGVAVLQQQSANLTQQIQNLQYEITTLSARVASEGAASSAGQSDATLVESLRNEQNQLSVELNDVNSQITTAELSSGAANGKAQILQRAQDLPSSKIAPLLEMAIIGIVLGLVGSISFVLIRRQRDRRLRLRDEIARTAGAPVIASLEVNGCTTVAAWRQLIESRLPATAEWPLRHVLHTLANRDQAISGVRVISFAGDMPALTTGPRLGLYSAASGIPTILMPEEHRSLVPMRAAFTSTELAGLGIPLTIAPDDIGGDSSALLVSISIYEGDLIVTAPPETLNILSISSGFVTAENLARLALGAADAKCNLDYVIVVNPDPSDMTNGLLTPNLPPRTPSRTSPPANNGGDVLVPLTSRPSIAKDSSERVLSQER